MAANMASKMAAIYLIYHNFASRQVKNMNKVSKYIF